MNCEEAQQSIALAVYGELPDEQRHLLTQHLVVCPACRDEYEAVEGLRKAMQLHPMEEPSANLMASARLRLDEALDAVPESGWLVRLGQRLRLDLARLGSIPVMASALLVLGLFAGGYGGFRLGRHQLHQEQARMILRALPIRPVHSVVVEPNAPQIKDASTVADMRGIDTQLAQIANVSEILNSPNSDQVEVRFNRLVPESVEGSIHDPDIRRLLLLAVENPQNPMVRDNSVNLLARECEQGSCEQGAIRRALMEALRYDRDPEVRLNALAGLEPYIAQDIQVRNAVLDSLLHDSDPLVQMQAMQSLAPIEADSSVRQVLETVSMEDSNPQIRNVSMQLLEQEPQVQ